MYFWLIDLLCCRGLQRWLGAARHSTITRSDCEISANSSVGLGASLSLAHSNNVTQMLFFFCLCVSSKWSLYYRELLGKEGARKEKWGQSVCASFERCEIYFENKYEQVIIALISDCSREHVYLCAPVQQNSPDSRGFFSSSIGIPPELSPHNDGVLPPSF